MDKLDDTLRTLKDGVEGIALAAKALTEIAVTAGRELASLAEALDAVGEHDLAERALVAAQETIAKLEMVADAAK